MANLGDNWNTALMTMTLMELLDRWEGVSSASQSFAELPSVRRALDAVFLDGDITGDGVTDGADLTFWQRGFGGRSGGIATQGDVDGDGAVDGCDLLRWQRGFGLTLTARAASVPEPGAVALWLAGGRRMLRPGGRTRRERPPTDQIDPCAANEPLPPLLTQETAEGDRRAAANCRHKDQ